ncbi:MAG: amidase [Candidatus Bruticola sp.]
MDICDLRATELAKLIREKKLSPVEVTQAYLERIDKLNPKINAFITLDPEGALEQARQAENSAISGPLRGVPIAIKDLSYTKGMRTTCGSLTLKDNIPDFDSISVTRIRQAGAVILGKTNTPEFGYKGITNNRLFGTTFNPWNTERHAGGSSGGSASAVAAGLVPLAEGTDGAGSIRIPASFCGVVGFKPSFAMVPRYPIPDLYYTLSHTGPIARHVDEAALLFEVLAGSSSHDNLSMNPIDWPKSAYDKLHIAYSPNLNYAPVENEVAEKVKLAVDKLADLGYIVREENPPIEEDPEPLELNIWNTVYASRYAPLTAEMKELLTPEMVDIIEEGTKLPAYIYSQDSIKRTKLYYTMDQFFERFDLLITPTMPLTAFSADLERPDNINGRKISTLFGWTPFTYPFNLTGQPAITIPAGLSSEGLPIGLQIIGPRGSDRLLLAVAQRFEEAVPFPKLNFN